MQELLFAENDLIQDSGKKKKKRGFGLRDKLKEYKEKRNEKKKKMSTTNEVSFKSLD